MMARAAQADQNDYEAERAKNIAANQALLKQLQLDSAGLGLSSASKAKKATSTAPRKKKTAVKKEVADFAPRRTSSRLAGLTADSEVAKRKAEDEFEQIQQAAKAKRQRVSGDIDLAGALVSGTWNESLVNAVMASKHVRTFTEEDVRETGDQDLKRLRELMSGLELYEGYTPNRECWKVLGSRAADRKTAEIKITPERIVSWLDEARRPGSPCSL